jgi:hypothetical protein
MFEHRPGRHACGHISSDSRPTCPPMAISRPADPPGRLIFVFGEHWSHRYSPACISVTCSTYERMLAHESGNGAMSSKSSLSLSARSMIVSARSVRGFGRWSPAITNAV